MKRFFTIIFIFLGIAIVSYLGWYFLKSRSATTSTPQTGNTFPTADDRTLPPSSAGSTGDSVVTDDRPETTATSTPAQTETSPEIAKKILYKRITSQNTAGMGIFGSLRQKNMTLRYIESATGNVYEYRVNATGTSPARLTNTTLPRVKEAYFLNNGTRALLRYLGDDGLPRNYLATLPSIGTTTKETKLSGQFIQNDVRSVAISPKDPKTGLQKIAYLEIVGGRGVGSIIDGDRKTLIHFIDSPFSDWLVSWIDQTTIGLRTRPSSNVFGHFYQMKLDGALKGGSIDKLQALLSEYRGLGVLPHPQGQWILLNRTGRKIFDTLLSDQKNHELQTFPVTTLAEKCVWAGGSSRVVYCGVPEIIRENSYPDAWYRGEVSFTDNLWKIDTETGSAIQFFSPVREVGESIDLIDPVMSDDSTMLFFRNKRDGSLWSFKVSELETTKEAY